MLATRAETMLTLDRTDKWRENQLRWVATWLPDVSFWVTRFPAVLTTWPTIFVTGLQAGAAVWILWSVNLRSLWNSSYSAAFGGMRQAERRGENDSPGRGTISVGRRVNQGVQENACIGRPRECMTLIGRCSYLGQTHE